MRGLRRWILAWMLSLAGLGGLVAWAEPTPAAFELKLGESGYLKVSAIGMAPLGTADSPSSQDSARQNALELARRKLLTSLLDLPVAPGKSRVRDRLNARPALRDRLRALIARAKVTGQDLADGSVEVTLELPYAGPGGLAEFLAALY